MFKSSELPPGVQGFPAWIRGRWSHRRSLPYLTGGRFHSRMQQEALVSHWDQLVSYGVELKMGLMP